MEQFLKQLNFADREITIYISLLKSGGATVSTLATRTGIRRTSTQEYLRNLHRSGFVLKSKVGNKMYYQAEDPDKFRQIIHERIYVVDKLVTELEKKNSDPEEWEIKAWSKNKIRSKIRRAQSRRRGTPHTAGKKERLIPFGDEVVGGSVAADKVFLFSEYSELEGIEIESSEITDFHKKLLNETLV